MQPHFVASLVCQLIGLATLVLDFSWDMLGLALGLHFLVGCLGVSLGYHRLLAHKAFRLAGPLELLFASLGALAFHGDPIQWVTVHRKHHRHAETEDDPHSPRRGFLWSHMLWFDQGFLPHVTEEEEKRYAPDLVDRWVYRVALRKGYPALALLILGLLWQGYGWRGVLWGGFVRALITNHSVWMINSVGHTLGWQAYRRSDDSSNCWWLGVLVFGEGWHNNHHTFPRSARMGLSLWQVDIGYWVVRVLEVLGLAWDVRRPHEHEVRVGSKPRNLGQLLGLTRATSR